MRVLIILGTSNKNNTRAILDLSLEELKDTDNQFVEIVLPIDMPKFC